MTSPDSGAAIENLYPALTECFAIIICGYFAGRMNLISETESKGINTFVGTFSLPSLIFMSLAQLDLSAVNWLFLASILISKSIVFFSVMVITLLVGRPVKLGRAGIFAIFCTQSNDFAIGYPIVAALYKTTHPDYASYLYLMAPISLAILNPISFVLMEVQKRRQLQAELTESTTTVAPSNQFKLFLHLTKNIFANPIIFMTILGIIGNFLFSHKIPSYLSGILDVLGSAFSASALFLLGLRMVGKVHKLRGVTLVVPGILIAVKLLVLPLVTREVISLLRPGVNASETVDLSTYGFLYGTFPAAPTVFVFSTQYSIDVDLIASAMVACTFISAPLMFVSAKMITLTKTDPANYLKQLNAFTFDISIVAIIASIWVIFVLCITKKIKRFPHRITAYLILSQSISCMGAILWNTLNEQDGWRGWLQFSIFTIGVYSARIWTALLAITMLFLQCRSLCFVVRLQLIWFVVGWAVPILIAIILLVFETRSKSDMNHRNPNFVYGEAQAIIAVSLLVISFIVTVGCLIMQQRHNRRFPHLIDGVNSPLISTCLPPNLPLNAPPNAPLNAPPNAPLNAPLNAPPNAPPNLPLTPNHPLPTIAEICCEDAISPLIDIEDLVPSESAPYCPSHFNCTPPKRQVCHDVLRQYHEQINTDLELIEEEFDSHEPQLLRHTVLLILLLCSMFVGLAVSIWTLVMEQMSGIYIELSFLDAILNFGQAIIVFAIFGLDTKEISLPIVKLWRKLIRGESRLMLPEWSELGVETKLICDQFVTYHLSGAKERLEVERRWRLRVYNGVFTGYAFVDWLIEVGLVRDRGEGVGYGRHLLEGRILKHINGVYHFYDRNLLYCFD